MFHRIVSLALASLLLCPAWGQGQSALPNLPADSPWRREVSYEIFVRAFADSDGDGIGDLKGVTSKLDYLQALGVRNLWLMPIHPAPTYHKYDATDYTAVAPEYGTMDDLRELTREAHKRGIRITLDLVFNHVSDRHPWFVSASTDPRSPYRDWFVWREGYRPETRLADLDSTREWYYAEAVNRHYYGLFWSRMPDLNLDNPAVRKELIRVGEFWLKEGGVDGFRLDAARHVYDRSPAGQAKGVQYWAEWRQALQRIKPDVYTVGEVWVDTDGIAPFMAAFDANFNFPLSYTLINAVKSGRDTVHTVGLARFFLQQDSAFRKVNPAHLNATFITNHDQARYTRQLRTLSEQKLVASLLLTLPGTPYLYYGEELGMIGPKPDPRIREPFPWSAGARENTRWRDSVRVGGSPDVAPLDRQQADANSLYQHYRQWIGLRNQHAALHSGSLRAVRMGTDQVVAFWREVPGQRLLVLHNLSAQPVTVAWPKGMPKRWATLGGTVQASAKGIELPARASVVLQAR